MKSQDVDVGTALGRNVRVSALWFLGVFVH